MADHRITNPPLSQLISLKTEQMAKDVKVSHSFETTTKGQKRNHEGNEIQIVGEINVEQDDTKLKQNHLEYVKKKKCNLSVNEIAQLKPKNSLSGPSYMPINVNIDVKELGNIYNSLSSQTVINEMSTIIKKETANLEPVPEETVAVIKKEPVDYLCVQQKRSKKSNLESGQDSPELFERVMISDISSDEEINTNLGVDDQAITSFNSNGNSLAAIAASLRALTHKIEDLKEIQRTTTHMGTPQYQPEGSWEEEVTAQKETANALQSVLYSLHKFLPHVVKIKENKKIVGLSPSTYERQIIVDINFEGSWLEKPEPASASEKIGHWPIPTQFPNSNKFATPPDHTNKIPLAVPCSFQDPELEKFLLAKSMNQGNKVLLNDAFDKPEYPLGPGIVHTILDSLARKAILERGISDTLLDAVAAIINTMLDDWERASGDLMEIKASLKEISKFLTLGHQTNWRCKSFIVAILVSNKVALRNYVLDNCGGPSTSKDIMKHTSFFTPSLFGEIPESLAKKVKSGSQTYWNHIIHTSKCYKKKKTPPYYNASKGVAQKSFNRQNRKVSDFGKKDRDFRQQVYCDPTQYKSKRKHAKKTMVERQRLEDNVVTSI
ncbi:unnamed protein product, partial [Meganyctiphanes norvegica]